MFANAFPDICYVKILRLDPATPVRFLSGTPYGIILLLWHASYVRLPSHLTPPDILRFFKKTYLVRGSTRISIGQHTSPDSKVGQATLYVGPSASVYFGWSRVYHYSFGLLSSSSSAISTSLIDRVKSFLQSPFELSPVLLWQPPRHLSPAITRAVNCWTIQANRIHSWLSVRHTSQEAVNWTPPCHSVYRLCNAVQCFFNCHVIDCLLYSIPVYTHVVLSYELCINVLAVYCAWDPLLAEAYPIFNTIITSSLGRKGPGPNRPRFHNHTGRRAASPHDVSIRLLDVIF